MRIRFRNIASLLLLLLISNATFAQDPDGWNDSDSADIPVDGGLALLIAAGAGYVLSRKEKVKPEAEKGDGEAKAD